jgi:hypothetical protein
MEEIPATEVLMSFALCDRQEGENLASLQPEIFDLNSY